MMTIEQALKTSGFNPAQLIALETLVKAVLHEQCKDVLRLEKEIEDLKRQVANLKRMVKL